MSEVINKPLYVRIQEYIADLILTGKMKPEDKLRSEREFSDELGVSRMTVRKAMTELVNEGLLDRRHGSGTYVAKPKVTYESHEMLNYVQAMQARNISTSSQLLDMEEIVASRRLSKPCKSRSVLPLFALRSSDMPIAFQLFWNAFSFPVNFFLTFRNGTWKKSSIVDLLTTVYNAQPQRISQTVEAVLASDIVARQLRVDESSPLLMLTRIIYSRETGKPVVFAQDFLRSDYARIHTDVNLE